jgi:MFS family permease
MKTCQESPMSQQLEEKKSFALDDSQIAQAETKLSGNSTTKFYLHLLKGSIVGALGGLLFGFDTAVIAGATHALTTEFSLDAASLGITVSSALWGTVISAMTAGIPGQKYGARDTLRWTAVLYVISAIGCALATNWWALLAFRFIGGLAIGASSVLGPVYIAELAPAAWRGRLVGLFQVNIVIGILLAYLSNFAIGAIS